MKKLIIVFIVAVVTVALITATRGKLYTRRFEEQPKPPVTTRRQFPRVTSLQPLQAPDYVTYQLPVVRDNSNNNDENNNFVDKKLKRRQVRKLKQLQQQQPPLQVPPFPRRQRSNKRMMAHRLYDDRVAMMTMMMSKNNNNNENNKNAPPQQQQQKNFFHSALSLLRDLVSGEVKPVQFISADQCQPRGAPHHPIVPYNHDYPRMYRIFGAAQRAMRRPSTTQALDSSSDEISDIEKYREQWMRLRRCMPLISEQKSLITIIGKSSSPTARAPTETTETTEATKEAQSAVPVPLPLAREQEQNEVVRDAIILPAVAAVEIQPMMQGAATLSGDAYSTADNVKVVASAMDSVTSSSATTSNCDAPVEEMDDSDMFQLGHDEWQQIPSKSLLKTLMLPYMNILAKVMSHRTTGSSSSSSSSPHLFKQMKVTLRRMPPYTRQRNHDVFATTTATTAAVSNNRFLRGVEQQQKTEAWWSQMAIWDVSDITDTQLYLHDTFFDVFKGDTMDLMSEEDARAATNFISEFYSEMMRVVFSDDDGAPLNKQSLLDMVRKIGSALGSLVTKSAAPSSICLACLVILSMFTPLVLNYVCFYIAQAMCAVWHLSDEQCAQMEVASLAVVVVLILPAAFVIWRLCHRTVCGTVAQYVVALGTLLGSLRGMMQPQ